MIVDLVNTVTGGMFIDVGDTEDLPVHQGRGSSGAVEVSPVVSEAAWAEISGGTVGYREEESDERVETETGGRHQPLPGRAGQVQQWPGLLRVLAGQQESLSQPHYEVSHAKPLQHSGQSQSTQVARLAGVDDEPEEDQDEGPLHHPHHQLPPGQRVTQLALGGDG